jgi:hypothetical protein
MKRYDCLRAIAPHFSEELVVTNLGAVRHEWQALRPHHVITICRISASRLPWRLV